jgi:hypothetical protein
MELTYAKYLADEGLRAELERRAHRERAEQMYRFFAGSARALLRPRVRLDNAQQACAAR